MSTNPLNKRRSASYARKTGPEQPGQSVDDYKSKSAGFRLGFQPGNRSPEDLLERGEAFSFTKNDRASSRPTLPSNLSIFTLSSGDDVMLFGSPVIGADTVTKADGLIYQVNRLLAELVLLGRSPLCVRRRKVNRAFELVCVELNPGPRKNAQAVNQIPRSSGPKKKKKGRTQQQSTGRDTSRPANTTRMSGVPAAFGMIAPRAYFSMRGVAQRLADQDSLNSVRCEGCALLSNGVVANPSGTAVITGALSSNLAQDNGYVNLSPSSVDPRLNALSQTYQFYAFRKLVLKYIPFVGTSTTGGLYLAIGKDADQVDENFLNATPGATGFSGGTPQNVMEYDPSLMTAVWQPAALTFSHTGTELWQTFPNGEEPTNERIQASVVAILEGSFTANTIVSFGHLWLEYEIDFYVPGPPLSSSSGSGGSLFLTAPAVPNSTLPTSGTSFTIADVESNASITSPVTVNCSITCGATAIGTAHMQVTDTATMTTTTIGDAFFLGANTVTQLAIPYLMKAGTQYLFSLIGAAAEVASAQNIFVKSV